MPRGLPRTSDGLRRPWVQVHRSLGGWTRSMTCATGTPLALPRPLFGTTCSGRFGLLDTGKGARRSHLDRNVTVDLPNSLTLPPLGLSHCKGLTIQISDHCGWRVNSQLSGAHLLQCWGSWMYYLAAYGRVCPGPPSSGERNNGSPGFPRQPAPGDGCRLWACRTTWVKLRRV